MPTSMQATILVEQRKPLEIAEIKLPDSFREELLFA